MTNAGGTGSASARGAGRKRERAVDARCGRSSGRELDGSCPACVAIGYAARDEERAQAELRWLFAGQWSDGLLPHIRFAEDARYFPGPEFWLTELSSKAPERPRTSGIVQPPVHATAVWTVYRRAEDREDASAFLAELYPKLVAWHQY